MNPYEPGDELDRVDPVLDAVAQRLEEHASRTAGEPPTGLPARILAAIEDEPLPAGRWAWLASWRGPMRAVAAGAALVIVIVGALAFGTLIDRARNDIGSSPPPVPSGSSSPTPSPSPSPTPSPSPSVAPSPTVSPAPSPTITPLPSPTDDDDDEVETPEPDETPEPGESDNSGPGGGGSSGSGSGDD
jgi:hypothetical protein